MNNLKDISKDRKRNFVNESNERQNKKWQIYSFEIAKRILAVIDRRKDINQQRIAEALNVSAQQVSKMVKGKENMTLESIYKISDVLGVQLISFPDYEDTFNVIETKKNILFENNYSHPEVKEKLILPNMSSENSSINIIFSQYDNLQMTKKYIEGIDVLPYYPTQELLS